MKRSCACDCHEAESVPASENSHFCPDCSEEDARLATYYLSRERTARSIIEGFIDFAERGRKWLEER